MLLGERHLFRLDLTQIQNVVDQSGQMLAVAMDDGQVEFIPVNLRKIIDGEAPGSLSLSRGDVISIPVLDKLVYVTGEVSIPGQVPSPLNYPSGCHFRDRCPHAFDRCAKEDPELMKLSDRHHAACFIADKLVKKQDGS